MEGCAARAVCQAASAKTLAGDHADLRLRADQSGFARFRPEADLLSVDECDVG